MLTSIAPGITKNDSLSTAPEAVPQLTNVVLLKIGGKSAGFGTKRVRISGHLNRNGPSPDGGASFASLKDIAWSLSGSIYRPGTGDGFTSKTAVSAVMLGSADSSERLVERNQKGSVEHCLKHV